ncbi:MAG: non-hydrolyzing UDP-N-acetylglucosamine 2-epimerase [Cellvibrionaceae bacterium]
MAVESKVSVLCVVGARPNFMKIAPIMRSFNRAGSQIKATLLHTGQHYDKAMKQSFFDQLGIPEPTIDLGVGGGSHAVQTADIMKRFEPVLLEVKPDFVLVVGDVNSTLACALVARKLRIGVIHVEAGLRSYDRDMPEEVNRVLTDQISDILFTTEESAEDNLAKEGIDRNRIHFVGNVMIDTLRFNLSRATPAAQTLSHFGISKKYALVTLHRPSNVDVDSILKGLVGTLIRAAKSLPLVFPVHPRTERSLKEKGYWSALEAENIVLLKPQGYLELLGLMREATVVLTDSGGLQEETTALGVPCITIRKSTERPITITEGTNVLVGTEPEKILSALDDVMASGGKTGCIPKFWDGHSADRISEVLGAINPCSESRVLP